jgi:uncharacterized protein (DUF2141 family)
MRKLRICLQKNMPKFSLMVFITGLLFLTSSGNQLVIQVKGVRKNHGVIRACLFTSPEQYLEKSDRCVEARPAGKETKLAFHDLPEGLYAVVVYHDENENGRIDLGTFRIPVEPYGFPGNPSTIFGPPSFRQAAILVKHDTTIIIKL